MKVRLSKQADRDLMDIYKYSFREFGEAQAERYYSSLWECFEFLAGHPHIGRLRLFNLRPARTITRSTLFSTIWPKMTF
jgi:plasmid stabilization system protein ParE